MEILIGNVPYFIGISRPAEASICSSFVEEKEAVALLGKALDPVIASAAEHIECVRRERVKMKVLFDEAGETIHPKAKICIPKPDEYVFEPGILLKHCAPP